MAALTAAVALSLSSTANATESSSDTLRLLATTLGNAGVFLGVPYVIDDYHYFGWTFKPYHRVDTASSNGSNYGIYWGYLF